jgi:hypothetical protein
VGLLQVHSMYRILKSRVVPGRKRSKNEASSPSSKLCSLCVASTRLRGTQRRIFGLVPVPGSATEFNSRLSATILIPAVSSGTHQVHARSGVPAGHLQIRPASRRGWRPVTGSWLARLPIGALYLLASRRFGDRRAPSCHQTPRLFTSDRAVSSG